MIDDSVNDGLVIKALAKHDQGFHRIAMEWFRDLLYFIRLGNDLVLILIDLERFAARGIMTQSRPL
jgi:hypothetical protein